MQYYSKPWDQDEVAKDKKNDGSEVVENVFAIGMALFSREVCGIMHTARSEQLFNICILAIAQPTTWPINVCEKVHGKLPFVQWAQN